jgi:hypothetical protein
MNAKELEQINAMSVTHLCDLLESGSQKGLKALRVILEEAEGYLDNEDDHVGRFAMGIAMNAIAARTDGHPDELTAQHIAQNMEDLGYLLLSLMEETKQNWDPELVSQLRRIQHPSYNEETPGPELGAVLGPAQ